MTRTVTTKAVKRIITKGLTGWEAGKLILQDFIYSYHGMDSVLTEADTAAIRNAPMKGNDIKDYNTFMALCRGFYKGCMLGEFTCTDACLRIAYLDRVLRDAEKRRTVELFESFGPHVVTRKQYEDIVTAQRVKKLKFEYSLGYVIEERFYATAPREAREEIDDLCPDIESIKDFISAVPEKYKVFSKQATDEIRRLYTSSKLPVVCHKKDMKKAEPLLAKWKTGRLSTQDTMKLVDMLYVTGLQLYECDKLPEWKDYMDKYHQYLFGDEDKRFQYVYAVLEDYSGVWVNEQDCYKGPPKPSEWITRNTELLLGLINHDNKAKKSIKSVGAELRDRLDTAIQNIRLFLAVKAILNAAVDAVELDVPVDKGMLAGPNTRLGATIDLYNIRLQELSEERCSWESSKTRLEKVLKMLPAIDPEKLRPSPDSLKQLKDKILKDAQGEEWLREMVLSLEYDDGFNFKELMRNQGIQN
ncbi:MAG: hypothetical protein ACYTFW_04550 [Planctomycetota bacterium]|jgi:hypothetical protein